MSSGQSVFPLQSRREGDKSVNLPYRKKFIRIIQETLIYIVCLFVELTSNNFPFFTRDLNFTTPCVPKSSTRPPLSPLRKHLKRFSIITISSFHFLVAFLFVIYPSV